MLHALHIFGLILFPCMWISGVTINSSILAVYLGDWRKGISPGLVEKILLTMAFTNVILQNIMTADKILYALEPFVRVTRGLVMADIILIHSIIYIQFLHTLCLAIFYCLRIVSFSHPFFIRLKMSLSSAIPPLIWATTFIAIAINIPFMWNVELHDETHVNSTGGKMRIEFNVPFLICNVTFGCCLPYILTLVLFGLCLSSLLCHMRRIKRNMSQLRAPQLKGHIRAAKTLGLRLLMDSTLCFLFITSLILFNKGNLWKAFVYSIMTVYPTAQSVILILGNPKLKSRLCVTWRHQQREAEGCGQTAMNTTEQKSD